jgi:hypothetical protein
VRYRARNKVKDRTPQDYADFLAGELPKWIAMATLSGAAAD